MSSAVKDYQRDHLGEFPIPNPDADQNVLCYRMDASYAHDCENAEFRQGMIDNKLLTKRYLREVPTDPRTGSRYVYGVTNDGKYFQVAGNYECDDGMYEARTIENLARGFELPSLIRAFDSQNFVLDQETYLPYSPDHLVLTAILENVNGYVVVDGNPVTNGDAVEEGQTIFTTSNILEVPHGSTDVYFSDGSVTHVDPESRLELKDMVVAKNDSEGTITKILLKLHAGKIWSKVVRLASESEFRIETTTAIAGVRGTEFGVDDTGEVKVKSGDVWKQDKGADMGEDVPVEEIYAIETPPKGDPIYSATPVAVPDDYREYYETIYLHSGIQPHILSVKPGGEITVRNADYFVDQIDEDDPSDLNRHIQVTHLAIYEIDLETGEPKYLYHVQYVVSEGADFTFTLSPAYLNKSIILRFEDIDPETDEMLNQSGFSDSPIHIESGTELIEGDIYEEEGAFELPILLVDAPDFMVINQLGEIVLTLEPPLADGDEVTYVVTSNSDVCTVTVDLQESNLFDITAISEGDCMLNIGVTFNGDDLPPEQVVIQILGEGTSQLVLEYPFNGQVLVNVNEVFPAWSAPNTPLGVTFDITFDGSQIPSVNSGEKGFTVASGTTHEWFIEMLEGGTVIETSETFSFDVIGGGDTLDFTIIPHNGVIDGNGDLVVDAATEIIDLSVNGSETGFYYKWTGSFFTDPVVGTAINGIEILDLAKDMPVNYTIYLAKYDSASDTLVKEISKLLTVVWQSVTITDIYFADIDDIDEPPAGLPEPTTPAYTNLASDLQLKLIALKSDGGWMPIPPSYFDSSGCLDMCDGSSCGGTFSFSQEAITYAVPQDLPTSAGNIICSLSASTMVEGYEVFAAESDEIMVEFAASGPVCGNETLDAGEACDDGSSNGETGYCSADCTQTWIAQKCTGTNTYYNDVNNECWVLGAAGAAADVVGQNCDEVCATINLSCKDSSSGGTDWDDDDNTNIACMTINSADSPDSKGQGGNTAYFAPYYQNNFKRCYSRDDTITPNDFDDPDTLGVTETLCSTKKSLLGMTNQRICKCE